MKWIRNIVVTLLLAFIFFSGVTGEKAPYKPSVEKSAKNSIEKAGYLKTAAFIKPYAGTNISSENRDHSPLIAKWFVTYVSIKFAHQTSFIVYPSFLRQDINRCLKVSILLFPFHIFW